MTARRDTRGELPTCWTRVERSEVSFVEGAIGQTEGIVLGARLDVPPRPGSARDKAGLTGSELKQAAQRAGVPYLIDPETWRLRHVDPDDKTSPDLRTRCAHSVPLPVRAKDLANDDALLALVRATVQMQAGAEVVFAPYFAFNRLDDPFLEINLRALRLTHKMVRGRPVGAWIYVGREVTANGVLRFAIERYKEALAPGATVLLTVGGLYDAELSAQIPYYRAIKAFRRAGLDVVLDRPGDLSLPGVAAGASGVSIGNRVFRFAHDPDTLDPMRRRGVRLAYFSGRPGRRIPLKKAMEQRRNGSRVVRACSTEGCTALQTGDALAVRLHNAHELRKALRRIHERGVDHQIWAWSIGRLKHQRVWAQALKEANAASAEA